MGNGYWAVTRSKPEDELKHFKYITKEKKNGKWRYYYEGDLDKKDGVREMYEKTSGDPKSKYGTYRHKNNNLNEDYTVTVKKGKSLLDKTTTTKTSNYVNQTREVGKIHQTYDTVKSKGKSAVKKLGKRTTREMSRQIDRGLNWLKNR